MLPVELRPSPPKKPEQPTARSPGQPCILLVEDSRDDAFFFERTLLKTGISCKLRHVKDGASAIELLEQTFGTSEGLPNAVFLDLKMPILNGFEVLEWVQEQAWAGTVPIFVLSGSNQTVDRERAARLGAAGYLVKPITKDDLTRKLQTLST